MDLDSADEARAVQSARECCSQPRRDCDQLEGGGQRGQPGGVAVNPGQRGAGRPGQCGRCRNGEPSWQPRDCAREKVERALAKAAGAIGCVLTRSGTSTSWSREECRRSFGKEG